MPLSMFHPVSEKTKREESLEAAFSYFNETSKQLEHSYRSLEGKFHALSQELGSVEAQREAEFKKNTELEQRMNALLDFLPGGVVVLNARGIVIESNPAANSLLNTDLTGKLWRQVISECFAPKNDDGYEVSTIDGKRLSISTSSLGVEGQIILLTDQTETRRLQENISRNERLSSMGKMVSALAHQIRTPLSAAVLYAGHLCDENLEQSIQKKFAKKCLGRLQHMEKQVRDMMLFVKSELPLNDIIDVRQLEMELQAAAEMAIDSSKSVCTWGNLIPDIKIKCHKEALVSSLMNLINNAIQSDTEIVALRIRLSEISRCGIRYVQVAVRDNGSGMDDDTLKRVEKIFTTTKSQGTGLGLSVVRSVAKAHAAHFYLKSKPGSGTLAIFEIPVFDSKNTELNR